MITTTNKEYYVVMDKLKRVVASGNFHQELVPRHSLAPGSLDNNIHVIDGIPSCCKITLKGNEAPLVVNIQYISKPGATG